MGRQIPLGPDQGEKELDTLVELHGQGGQTALIAVEVKGNLSALEHSLKIYGDRQLRRLARAAKLVGAVPVLAINEGGTSSEMIDRLGQVSAACTSETGKALLVLGPNLKPIDLTRHPAPRPSATSS
jgi:hypothetical protein